MKGQEDKHTRSFSETKLKAGEEVRSHLQCYIGEMMGKGKDTQHNGQFIVTDQRVCFYRKGILGEVLETIPLDKITSVEQRALLGHRVLTLHTSHDELSIKSFEDKETFNDVVALIDDLRSSGNKPVLAVPAIAESIPDQIRKLKELEQAGILTAGEFEAKKADLLARM